MRSRQSKGFTLIELMLVVGIIGILVAVAMAYYGDYIIDANRTDGRKALTENAAALEKCKALYGAYNHANCAAVVQTPSESGYYTITVGSTNTTFTLTATPVVGQPQANDIDCTSLTLTNTGMEGGTGANAAAECW